MNQLDWRQYSDEELAKMRFLALEQMRKQFPEREAQNRLAPFEHRAFTRGLIGEEGPQWAALMAGATPAYTAAKALSSDNFGARSDPSWAEILQGYAGIGEGLMDWSKSKVKTRARNPLEP